MSLRILLEKDLRREWRGREAFQAGIVLVGTFLLLFLFAIPEGQAGAVAVWVPVVYASAAIAGRGMADEFATGTIDLLRTSGAPLVWHGVSRTIVDGLLTMLVSLLALAALAALFAMPWSGALAVAVLLGALGLTIVGSLTGALAAQTRAREILLPVLLVPVVAPLLLSGVRATEAALAGTDAGPALLLMAGYDVVVAGVAWLLWPVVLEGD